MVNEMEKLGCIFCKIANDELESHKIYEDEWSVAFLDIRPINPGHILVIPRSHSSTISELEEKTYIQLMLTLRNMSGIVEKTINPKKVGIAVAGFDVDHLHVHVVPMFDYHDITSQKYLNGSISNADQTELSAMANKFKKIIDFCS